MRTAHFDCFSGISGDMTLAALIDAGVDADAIRAGLASLELPIQLEIDHVRKCGIAATYVHIEAPEEHTHRFLPQIEDIIGRGRLTERQRGLALAIFRRLAEAEAAVHGVAIDKVHFHEVGALDSIADIVGAAIGIDLLGVERVTSRSVPTGVGMVQCAHGLMPIPAPATARLLRGVPLAAVNVKGELTTPTGAAILTSIVQEWSESPQIMIDRIGHGAGRRELMEQPNVLRLLVGESTAQPAADYAWVLETNLDDVPAEFVGYTQERLIAAGALDVYCTSILMKKNRPGVLLSVIATEATITEIEEILFRETTTFGIRRYRVERHKLERRAHSVETKWGPVQGKLGWLPGRTPVFTPEYEDCARIAREQQVPLREVYAVSTEAYRKQGSKEL